MRANSEKESLNAQITYGNTAKTKSMLNAPSRKVDQTKDGCNSTGTRSPSDVISTDRHNQYINISSSEIWS